MNEFGVDVAFDVRLTPAMMPQLDFAIPRIGTLGYGQIGSPAYYSKRLNIDSGFRANIDLLANSGKYYGCYIFSYAWDEESARAEATKVCDALDSFGYQGLPLPIFFDWERTGAGTYGSYEMVTAAGITVTPALVQLLTRTFCETCVSRGYRAGWYQSAGDLAEWWGRTLVRDYRETRGYYLWVAQWASSTSWADNADLWQYNGDVEWNGIDADLNRALTDRLFSDTGRKLKKFLLMYWTAKRKTQNPVFRKKV